MSYTPPTIADFKARFVRDFPYATDQSDFTKVVNADIQSAIDDSVSLINQALFGSQAEYGTAYLYLAAHFLVTNLQSSAQGVSGAYAWLTASKAAGGVNQSFSIPERILKNPLWAQVSQTPYGARYLSLIIGKLVAPFSMVDGRTQP